MCGHKCSPSGENSMVSPQMVYVQVRRETWDVKWKQIWAIKELLEILFLARKMCAGFTTDGICMNTMCAVSLANHLRAVADVFRPLKTHQHYWTTEKWTSPKQSPSNRYHTACGESRKYISENVIVFITSVYCVLFVVIYINCNLIRSASREFYY